MMARYTAVLTSHGNMVIASNPETGVYVGGTDRDAALETLRQQLEIRERTMAAGPFSNEEDLPRLDAKQIEVLDTRRNDTW
jgi:hypothetical protein